MADKVESQEPTGKPPARKFSVEPVETTTKSSRGKQEGDSQKAPRRFAVQPVETSTKSRKNNGRPQSPTKGVVSARGSSSEGSKAQRKFSPQLIETTSRVRRRGDTVPALRELTDKTDLSPGDYVHLPRHMRMERERPGALPIPPANSPVTSTSEVPTINNSRFSSENLAKHTQRRTSVRKPRLEPISSLPESDESNPSNVPSLSTTPSADSEPVDMSKHPSRMRESMDERFSGYLLALAARVAEQQLKEQAMAAYPNENTHEPVDHFAVNRESEEDTDEEMMGFGMLSRDEDVEMSHGRRESEAGWDLAEMKKHRENLEKQRQEHAETEKKSETQKQERPTPKPFANPFGALPDVPKNTIGGGIQSPNELTKMRSAASPPMLGKDLVFPTCPSPKQTMMDPTQRPRKPGHDDEDDEKSLVSRQASGLWTPISTGSPAVSPHVSRKQSATGLWHGVCIAENGVDNLCPPTILQTGLMTPAIRTPAVEAPDPFSSLSVTNSMWGQSSRAPATNATPNGKTQFQLEVTSIDSKLSFESSLEQEFPDDFVTQVYNYLSLGYPALARAYDHELSKISRISVPEIRNDDARKNSKGHIGAPEGEGWDESSAKETCGRWRALKLYIKEWGRQEGRMVKGNGAWGQIVRRGSWAI